MRIVAMAGLLSVLLVGWQADATEIVVRAGQDGFAGGPLSAAVILSKPGKTPLQARLYGQAGTTAVAQWVLDDEGGRLWWWQPPLAAGEISHWRLEWTPVKALARSGEGVDLVRQADGVEVRIDGRLFTRYVMEGAPKPYCWPIIGPTGQPVTRAFPMADVEGEARDHPHQRSLWFTHGEVNGLDFWSESDRAGRTVHEELLTLQSGPVLGRLRARTNWLAPDGAKVCEDERELRFFRCPIGRLLDFTITLRSTSSDVVLGDTKEGTFGLRVAQSLNVKGGRGHILTATGLRDGDAWGKRAEWCDYYGLLGGDLVGIAIFDHPSNLRHPTYWHVRDYGLFAANPFGLRHFINATPGAGNHTIPAGGALTLTYRVWIHQGHPQRVGVARHYQSFAHPPQVEVVE